MTNLTYNKGEEICQRIGVLSNIWLQDADSWDAMTDLNHKDKIDTLCAHMNGQTVMVTL